MPFDNLLLEQDGAVAVVTVNRPKVLNALNAATIAELGRVFADLKADDSVRVVILTGAGEKSFVAGADVGELAAQTAASAQVVARKGQAVFAGIEQLGKPVIAAVNGFALGGGCELAMACTLRLAADTARFGQPEVNLGLIPGYAGTQRLPRLVGKGVALDLLLTGRMVKADEALAIGLVNRVVPEPDLDGYVRTFAATIGGNAPLTIKAAKMAINAAMEDAEKRPLAEIDVAIKACFASEDYIEGRRAFMEKRKANFKGR